MPIQGVTTGDAPLPVVGHIRKGDTRPDGSPVELQHMRFTSDEPELVARWVEVYGAQPMRITVRLPYDDPEQVLEAWMEEYTAGTLQRRCDGGSCVWRRLPDGGSDSTPSPCAKDAQRRCACKPVGRLYLVLPDLMTLGVVVAHTGSWDDIRRLSASLRAMHQLGVPLRGTPFILQRVARDVSMPSDRGRGGRVRRKKWMLDLQVDPSWVPHIMASLPMMDAGALQLTGGEATVDDAVEGEAWDAVWEQEVDDACATLVPPQAAKRAGVDYVEGQTLGECDVVTLQALAGIVPSTDQGRDFQAAAALVLSKLWPQGVA